MKTLADVTLVAIETREHKLQVLALQDCLKQIAFAEVLVFTDRPLEFAALTQQCEPRIIAVPDWPDKEGWSRANWQLVPGYLRTAFALNIQWDSWLWDAAMWRDEFLAYDYIGAPWTWYAERRVGNGGFSLVSTALRRYIARHRDRYPIVNALDDDLVCRRYRPMLEEQGFRWAPERVARDFAYEGAGGDKPTRHFGFHAAMNFNRVLDRERLIERARLMFESPTIMQPDSYILKTFTERNPELVRELLADELKRAEQSA